jgi:hypothetical protein
MTSTSLRIRLALALGLPLAPACKASPSTDPMTPDRTAPTTTTPSTTTPTTVTTPTTASSGSTCAPDHVHEHVCGLIDTSFAGGGGQAAAPYEHCTLNGLPLWDVETRHVIDGWKIGSHDEVLAEFAFDAPGTAGFEYTGTYYPEDPRCCYERCNPIEALAKPRQAIPQGAHEYELCLPSPESTEFPAATAKGCPAALRTRHFYPYGTPDPLDDAPFLRAIDDHCCYSVATLHRCPPNTFETKDGGCEQPSPGGRPLRDGERIVVAPTHTRDGWHSPMAAQQAYSAAARAYAAAAWAREAAYEHASVAAFARLAIDLMVHGAPSELVDAAHVAARDEIRHAQRCYGIASAFGGSVVGPGPLALAAISTAPTLVDLALACFRDGCVNETVAALSVAEASRLAASPTIRETLAAIAEDEARHAELSYRILAWALRVGDASLRARVADELESVRCELAREPTVGQAHRDHDETTGLLAPRTAAQVRRRVLADVVIPCTDALLARHA